jgi:hypothetical protein
MGLSYFDALHDRVMTAMCLHTLARNLELAGALTAAFNNGHAEGYDSGEAWGWERGESAGFAKGYAEGERDCLLDR